MPIFDYECEECGVVENVIAGTNDKTIVHDKCGKNMTRFISGNKAISMGPAGAFGYYDDNLETYIHTNRQHREVMKEKGVSEKYGKGWY